MSLLSSALGKGLDTLATVGDPLTIVIAGRSYTGTGSILESKDMQEAGILEMFDASITLKSSDLSTVPQADDAAVMNGTNYWIKTVSNVCGTLRLELKKRV